MKGRRYPLSMDKHVGSKAHKNALNRLLSQWEFQITCMHQHQVSSIRFVTYTLSRKRFRTLEQMRSSYGQQVENRGKSSTC